MIPLNPSGIRLGTPALTSRGFIEEDMKIIGQIIAQILKNPAEQKVIASVKQEVTALTKKYPLYPELN